MTPSSKQFCSFAGPGAPAETAGEALGLDKLFLAMMHVALDQSSGKLVFQKDQSKPGVDGIKLLMAILKAHPKP